MKRRMVAVGAALAAVAAYFSYNTVFGQISGYTNKLVNLGAVPATELCHGPADHAQFLCLATALKSTASPQLLAELQRPYSVAEASKWSNFPPRGYGDRVGPTFGDLSPEQLAIAKALLKSAAGIAADEGYDEMEQILNADDYLATNTTDTAGFASGNYHIAFLGEPAAIGTWQLYFGGHHLAFGNTYKDGKLVGATPSFRGVEPFTSFQQNGRDNAPMIQEQAAFAAMLNALSPDELAKAKLGQTYTNIVLGPQKDNQFPQAREGLKASELSPAQQDLVIAAMATYVQDIDEANAATLLARYKSEIADTYIAFAGTIGMNAENDYVRIDGPTVWIESSMQPGRSVPGIHPHSVWRDKSADYGGNN